MNKNSHPAAIRGAVLTFLLVGAAGLSARGQAVVSTVAGSGTAGSADGPALTAQFNQPLGIAVDAQGTAYVADQMNHSIRKITAAGAVTTLAGNGRGYFDHPNPLFAAFAIPERLLLTAQGNLLVADTGNGSIRQIAPTGAVTTLAGTGVGGYVDGPAASARFSSPVGLAQDATGNVYVADAANYRIRRIDPAGLVTTLAGSGVRGFLDGPAATARFFEPQGIALDAAGNLYIADRAAQRIRRLSPAGVVSTYAGSGTAGYLDGPAATAQFNSPISVAVDARGDVYVTERAGNRLRRIEAATGLVSTVAGTGMAGYLDGPALSAQLSNPVGLAIQGGSLYVADAGNHRIRRISGLPLTARAAGTAAGLRLEAFPNPFTNRVSLRYFLPKPDAVQLTVLDALGRTVAVLLSNENQAAGWHTLTFEPGPLAAGVYHGRLKTSQAIITYRMLLVR